MLDIWHRDGKIWGPVEKMPLRNSTGCFSPQSVSPQHKGTFSPTISNSQSAFLHHLAPIKHSRLDYVTFIRLPTQTNPGKLIRSLGLSWKGFDCGWWCALHQWPLHSWGTFVMPIVLKPGLSFSAQSCLWSWPYPSPWSKAHQQQFGKVGCLCYILSERIPNNRLKDTTDRPRCSKWFQSHLRIHSNMYQAFILEETWKRSSK